MFSKSEHIRNVASAITELKLNYHITLQCETSGHTSIITRIKIFREATFHSLRQNIENVNFYHCDLTLRYKKGFLY
jgi:hypothetical protein